MYYKPENYTGKLVRLILRFSFFLSFACNFNIAIAQDNTKIIQSDSILIRKGSRVTLGNISFIPTKDTVINVPDTVFFRVRYDSELRTQSFYDSLEIRAERSKFTKGLYNLAFVSQNRKKKDTVLNMESELPFLDYAGKVINNIRIKRLDVFGPELYDTTLEAKTKIARILNTVHLDSREWVIKQNLRIRKGEIINPLILAENERILRELPYIEDALIRVIETNPESDSVDILVMTKDVWSIAVIPIVKSATSATFKIYDANILGMGHKLSNKIGFNLNESPVARYKQFGYEIQNIMGSFVKGSFEYLNNPEEKSYKLSASRPFMPPILTIAGGGGITKINRDVTYVTDDTIRNPGKLEYITYNLWGGKTFPLKFHEISGKNKNYFTLTALYSNYSYLEHQQFQDENKYKYENREIVLIGLSLSRNNYHMANMIYSFGKTEDIAYGYNISCTFGEKFGEYDNMFYSSLKLSYGNFTPKNRYYYAGAEYGGYLSEGKVEEGILFTQITYASGLSGLFRSKLRSFINIKYLQGINRYNYEKIYLDDAHGFRGIGMEETLSGTSRLTINMESVLFTPFYFFGFRIAAFGYIDNGFISYNKKILATSNYFMGIGFGIRVRNENLIFNTFQFNIAFYPVKPDNISTTFFEINSVDSASPGNFNPTSPGLVIFE